MAGIVHDLLRRGVSVLAEGNFRPESSLGRELPPCRVVQIHVSASPEVIRARLMSRGSDRHPVHYDAEAADEIAERGRGGEWEALPLAGRLIRVDTSSGFPDPAALARSVSR
jgi:hypothetical protein